MNDDDLKKLIYRCALTNAVKHKGKAQSSAVLGMIIGSHPEMRKRAYEIVEIVDKVIIDVNSLDPQTQIIEIEKLGLVIEGKKTEERGLPDLGKVQGNVVLRFAPNPSGPLHIGHARAVILNHEYVEKYGGRLILRMEDTDPRRVDLDAYGMIEEDLRWLGIHWHDKVIQSDRIEIYYEHAEKLIKMNAAYMCTCEGGEFKKLKDESNACPCRDLDVVTNLKRWKNMGNLSEGEAVLRIKTDLKHKNPAIRDWVAMRIVEEVHPRIGSKYRVYPMMNFAVAVDDHLLGVTHVLRGKDHLANTEKQKYLYHHFKWSTPVFIHYGKLKMEDIPLSTSKAREGIQEGVYSGWDDPRLGTLRALARRGIMREAIYELISEIGIKIADSTLSWKKIYGLNRAILEEVANRYFLVWNPVEIQINDLPERSKGLIKRLLHPDFKDRGYREIPFDGDVYLVEEDVTRNKILRLMDAVNIMFKDEEAVFYSSGLDNARKVKAQLVQWVPVHNNINVEVVMPDATRIPGLVEPSCSGLQIGDMVQFERFGFCRVDNLREAGMTFYFAHK